MSWKFKQAKGYYKGRLRKVSRIGIHCTETGNNTAPGVANFFATSGKSSAHVVVDTDEVITCVKFTDTAWAMPSVNADGWHIEICGYAKWSRDEWLQGRGKQQLIWAACVAAEAVTLFNFLGANFEVRELTDTELRKGTGEGFVKHSSATRVFGPRGGHTDPGQGFPQDVFFDMVNWWLPRITTIDIK